MKQVFLLLMLWVFNGPAQAEKTPRAKTTNIIHEGSVHIQFNHFAPADDHKDSALIIFDRYNHTGAGVVYKVFSADKDSRIIIGNIPAGKYYVTIQGLGVHRDRLEKVISVKSNKKHQVKIKLEDSEEFDKSRVVIPAYRPDPSNSIVMMK